MKLRNDQETNSLSIVLKQDTLVEESDETKAGVTLDYDNTGELVSIEILNASERVPPYSAPR